MSATRPEVIRFDPFHGPPRLHGPTRVGIRPGTAIIHPLAATGTRPLRFEVDGLPVGVTVDDDGTLRGVAPLEPGELDLRVRVVNASGTTEGTVRLCVGPTLALTPPMGWNSWNVFAQEVSAEVIVRTAEAMVANGMRDLGYQYVNIDDHWHAEARHPDGTPRANPRTFPDGIAPVAEAVHALGLKLGIYSDAAHLTCGKCFGGYGYEAIDARAYAEWGVDLLKYDYCHAPRSRRAAIARYGAMSRALRSSGRSIVLSVCEWGFRKPWTWAPDLGGSYWRTTPDIFDSFSWSIVGVRGIARRNLALADHSGPGAWNDPDMLVVGNHGTGRATGQLRLPGGRVLHRFGGLDDGQAQTHVTLWAMMAAPLLASHDLTSADEFDTALLTNPDVLAVDQDELGRGARRVRSTTGVWQLVKPLADGGVAISLTNMGPAPRTASVTLAHHVDLARTGDLEVVEAWTGERLRRPGPLRARLGRHRSVLFVARPRRAVLPPGAGG